MISLEKWKLKAWRIYRPTGILVQIDYSHNVVLIYQISKSQVSINAAASQSVNVDSNSQDDTTSQGPYSVGDSAFLEDEIVKIVSLYEEEGESYAHVRQFIRGSETILAETHDEERELFESNTCKNVLLAELKGKAKVSQGDFDKLWGKKKPMKVPSINGFYCRLIVKSDWQCLKD